MSVIELESRGLSSSGEFACIATINFREKRIYRQIDPPAAEVSGDGISGLAAAEASPQPTLAWRPIPLELVARPNCDVARCIVAESGDGVRAYPILNTFPVPASR